MVACALDTLRRAGCETLTQRTRRAHVTRHAEWSFTCRASRATPRTDGRPLVHGLARGPSVHPVVRALAPVPALALGPGRNLGSSLGRGQGRRRDCGLARGRRVQPDGATRGHDRACGAGPRPRPPRVCPCPDHRSCAGPDPTRPRAQCATRHCLRTRLCVHRVPPHVQSSPLPLPRLFRLHHRRLLCRTGPTRSSRARTVAPHIAHPQTGRRARANLLQSNLHPSRKRTVPGRRLLCRRNHHHRLRWHPSPWRRQFRLPATRAVSFGAGRTPKTGAYSPSLRAPRRQHP
jgi:hypothetical protein